MALEGVKENEEFLWFRGGATVIIDPRKGQEEIRYAIIKNTGSGARQAKAAAVHYMSPLRALYFGETKSEPFAMLHADQGDTTMAKALAKPRKRTSAAANATAPASVVTSALPALTVRHYCQGIGDSHLLTFRKSDGSLFRILIDCGVHTSIAGVEISFEISLPISRRRQAERSMSWS